MKGELHPDRNIMHRWMGPPDSCERCYGRGWHLECVPGTEDDYIPDAREAYCECPCGVRRKELECNTDQTDAQRQLP